MRKLEIIGISLPDIKPGDNIAKLIYRALADEGLSLQDYDILVISQVIVSKAEGRIVKLDSVKVSSQAEELALILGKDKRVVEIILRECKSILRVGNKSIIVETKNGLKCASSGVDLSNVDGGLSMALLPLNPDKSAKIIREELERLTGRRLAVIISDTLGRPLRRGQINIAIGVSGIKPIYDRRGEKDLYGYKLEAKQIAVADELASAAELVMGQASEGIPVVIVRGYKYQADDDASSTELIRSKEEELFL